MSRNSNWDFVQFCDQLTVRLARYVQTYRKRHDAAPPMPKQQVQHARTINAVIERFNRRQYHHTDQEATAALMLADWLIVQVAEMANLEPRLISMHINPLTDWTQAEPITREEARRTTFDYDDATGAMVGRRHDHGR
jgi:hypothetical protein